MIQDQVVKQTTSNVGRKASAKNKVKKKQKTKQEYGEPGALFNQAFKNIIENKQANDSQQIISIPKILQNDKEISKNKQQQKQDEAQTKETLEKKKILKNRGRQTVQPKGVDVNADLKERNLQRLATRGVVQLFNAVGKAQNQIEKEQEKGLQNIAGRLVLPDTNNNSSQQRSQRSQQDSKDDIVFRDMAKEARSIQDGEDSDNDMTNEDLKSECGESDISQGESE